MVPLGGHFEILPNTAQQVQRQNWKIMKGSFTAAQTFPYLLHVGCFDLGSDVQKFINFIKFGHTSTICSATSLFSIQRVAQ